MRADLIAKLQRIRRRLEEMEGIVEKIDEALKDMPKFRRLRISKDVALKLERLSEKVGIDPNHLATALITIELVKAKLELTRR